MAKAKQINNNEIPKTENNPDEIHHIDLNLIEPSPFDAQKMRRAQFNEDDLFELGTSIASNGLFQPILVRPAGTKFQIVFGERRFLGSQRLNLATIKCFVRDLADAEVLKMQYVENHKRMKPSPLGDAFIFHDLMETQGYDVSRNADQLATSPQNVTEKLKLMDLIPEAVRQLEAELLPLRHAYYLATFPADTQKLIVEEGYAYLYHQTEYGAVSYQVFKEEIGEHIVRKLSDAPFDIEDERLHMTGLPCSKCTERTGYKPALFAEISSDDSCLNRACFQFKTNVNLRLQRQEIAESLPNPENKPIEEQVKEVPLVTERKYADKTPFREKVQTRVEILDRKECEFSILSLAVEGEKKGQKVWVCRNKDCEFHNPGPPPVDEIPDQDVLQKKEAEFERKVSHVVRTKVFEKAVEYFDDYKVFWQFDDLVRALIASYLETIQFQCDDIFYLIRNWKNVPKSIRNSDWIAEFVASLDKRQMSQMLFLLANLRELYARRESGSRTIEKICSDYTKESFRRIDAETRLELAPDEFKPVAADYLERVKNGEPCEMPHFWFQDEFAGVELNIED